MQTQDAAEPAADRLLEPATEVTRDSALRAVLDLCPRIVERAAEIEAGRRLPADLNEQLREAGLYRLLVPRSHGGAGLDVGDVIEIIETLARADGSVAWVAAIGIQSPCILSFLPRQTFDEIYAGGPDVTVGGALAPQGKAQRMPGGFRVSGKWAFGSGCDNWDYLFGNCVIEGEEPIEGPMGFGPPTRAVLLRREDVELFDTWHTLGLRGTGSKHFAVEDFFVPEAWSFDLLGGTPCIEGMTANPALELSRHVSAVALGVAYGAIDELVSSAKTRKRALAATTVADLPAIQQQIGAAETRLHAGREMLYSGAAALPAGAEAADLPTQMVRARSETAWTVQACRDAISACFCANGSTGIYDGSPLQRRLRDIYTIIQHNTANDDSITMRGASVLGG